MSVTDAQQRIAAIQARFLAPPAASTGPSGPAGPSRGSYSFATALDRAGRTYPTAATGGGQGGPPEGTAVVNSALRHLGVPYRWGGESPDGFDCSGLVQFVFAGHGVTLPRVSTDQALAGRPVPVDDLRPGDLVFFGRPVDHVGIYSADNQMIVAPKTGDVVKIQTFDPSTVTAARRVLPDRADGLPVGSGAAAAGAATWAGRLPAAGQRFAGVIEGAARAAGIDPPLLAAVTWSESGFDPAAVSPAGAVGLTQLMPATAAGLGVDPADPAQNLAGGARYLAGQLRRFGRVELALAAYNAGPSAVTRAGGVPPYPETQAFVARVLTRFQSLRET